MYRTLLIILFATQLLVCEPLGCPVTVRDFAARTNCPRYYRKMNETYWFYVSIKNTRSSPVQEVEMAGAYAGEDGEFHELPFTYFLHNLKPEQRKTEIFSYHRLIDPAHRIRELKIWVKQVRFKDGETWSDEGQQRCSKQDVNDCRSSYACGL